MLAFLASTALGCAHTESLSDKPNTVSTTRPFTRSNEPITGDVGVNVDSNGVELRPENQQRKTEQAVETQPYAQPPPPKPPTPPPPPAAPTAPVDNNGGQVNP